MQSSFNHLLWTVPWGTGCSIIVCTWTHVNRIMAKSVKSESESITRIWNNNKDLKQVVKVIWRKAASPPHIAGSVIFARWRQCAPHIKPKLVAMATSHRCTVSAISAFCRPITHTPSITNCLVATLHTKPANSNFSPKIGCHGNVPQHRWTPI